MIWNRKCLGIFLALLWLPATLHCALETAGCFEAPACDEQTADSQASKSESCATDDCDRVESGFYKATLGSLTLPAPTLQLCLDCFRAAPAETLFIPRIAPERIKLPLEFSPTWQFVVRAAPQPRAPSCAS